MELKSKFDINDIVEYNGNTYKVVDINLNMISNSLTLSNEELSIVVHESDIKLMDKRKQFGDDKYNLNKDFLDQFDLSRFIVEGVNLYYILSAINRGIYDDQSEFNDNCFKYMTDTEAGEYLASRYGYELVSKSDYRKEFIKNV